MVQAVPWFVLEALLLCLLVVFGSLGCGVGILFPLLGGEKEKREALAIARPFAPVQAVLFSAVPAGLLMGCPAALPVLVDFLPVPTMLFLTGLVLRTTATQVRPWRNRNWSRAGWSATVLSGSLLAMFSVGYVAANLLFGFPIGPTASAGPPVRSFSLFSVIGGFLLVTFAAFQGLLFLSIRAEGSLQKTLRRDMPVLAVNLIVFALAAGIILALDVPSSRPWSTGRPLHWIFAGFAVLMAVLLVITVLKKSWKKAFGFSSLVSSFVILSLAAAQYPLVIPSRTDPSASIRATDAAAAAGLPAALTLLSSALVVILASLLFLLLWRDREPRSGNGGLQASK